ncbi:hypothetical protein [Streptomyces sp. NPDC052114]|uniref:hypothetical protein n=1 Tax=unclassified Streptomyces TaxID=2593676 RepID=UPI0034400A22
MPITQQQFTLVVEGRNGETHLGWLRLRGPMLGGAEFVGAELSRLAVLLVPLIHPYCETEALRGNVLGELTPICISGWRTSSYRMTLQSSGKQTGTSPIPTSSGRDATSGSTTLT